MHEGPPSDEQRAYPNIEHLWEFAGQGLRSSDFNTAMVHFYRAEVTRSNTWRHRLDNTTNWAVITTAAALTFAFGAPNNTHIVILLVTLLVLLFLFIEARRYRYYELWTYRVRLMETNYFVGLLSPPFTPGSDWAGRVTESLKHPAFPITLGEAFGRRFRRNYAFIFLILALSWVLKVSLHPVPATSFSEFLDQAAAGPVPGAAILLGGIIFNSVLFAVGALTARMRQTTAEVFADVSGGGFISRLGRRLRALSWEVFEMDLPAITHMVDSKQLAYIVSDHEEKVSRSVIDELGRGVTRLQGKGMYTGEEHGVLMVAFSSRQTELLKRVVKQADPEAFLIIVGARDVRGAGFRPLEV
jgi:uncharacterized membrane protein